MYLSLFYLFLLGSCLGALKRKQSAHDDNECNKRIHVSLRESIQEVPPPLEPTPIMPVDTTTSIAMDYGCLVRANYDAMALNTISLNKKYVAQGHNPIIWCDHSGFASFLVYPSPGIGSPISEVHLEDGGRLRIVRNSYFTGHFIIYQAVEGDVRFMSINVNGVCELPPARKMFYILTSDVVDGGLIATLVETAKVGNFSETLPEVSPIYGIFEIERVNFVWMALH